MEPEEEPSVAAVREVCEEVGFVIEFQQLLYLAYPFLNNCICFFYLLSILTQIVHWETFLDLCYGNMDVKRAFLD